MDRAMTASRKPDHNSRHESEAWRSNLNRKLEMLLTELRKLQEVLDSLLNDMERLNAEWTRSHAA